MPKCNFENQCYFVGGEDQFYSVGHNKDMESSFTSQTSYSTVSSKSDLTNSDHLCIDIEINHVSHIYMGDFNMGNIIFIIFFYLE